MIETYEERNVGAGSSRAQTEAMVEEFRRKGKGFIEEQKHTAAESLERFASVLHDTAGHLEQEQPTMARLFGQGAETLGRISQNLRHQDAGGMLRQLQEFSRRQPALMLGGAVVAGFLLTRVIKSTPHREENEHRGEAGRFQGAETMPGPLSSGDTGEDTVRSDLVRPESEAAPPEGVERKLILEEDRHASE